MKAWVNGALVDDTAGVVSPRDHGFTVGDGVFETLKLIDGEAFALTRHVDRLGRSARGLGLRQPEPDEVRTAVRETLAANRAAIGPLGRLRITFTSGPGILGSDRSSGPATLAVVTEAATPWPATTAIAVSPWPRNERSPLVGLKSTSYAENAVALAWAKQRGASEAVLGNLAGDLCEGTGSNVFIVVSDQIFTPPLESGCLAGITRDLVLEWSAAREERLPLESLATADEVFLTSSTRDVHPVVGIDGRTLAAGPITQRLAGVFAEHVRRGIDP